MLRSNAIRHVGLESFAFLPIWRDGTLAMVKEAEMLSIFYAKRALILPFWCLITLLSRSQLFKNPSTSKETLDRARSRNRILVSSLDDYVGCVYIEQHIWASGECVIFVIGKVI